MDVQVWDDQHELTYSSYVRTRPEDLPEAMSDREKWREDGQGYPRRRRRHDDDEYS